MLRPRLRIPRVPRFGSLATPSSPSPFLPSAALAPFRQRSIHTVPELEHKFIQPEKDWLLSEIGFSIAWRDYQSLMLHKLNSLTAGSDFESKDLKTTLLHTARDPEFAPTFNYASMAHNNHFFFKNLAPSPVKMPEALRAQLEASFGSIETLRREMVNTADAMFGPGFVWLVKVEQKGMFAAFKVLPTYLAGSPYPGAHWRRQDVDLTTGVGSTEQGLKTARRYLEDTAYGQGRLSEAAERRNRAAPGGIDVVPVLCLNVWEHVYLADFSVGGKLAFAEKWWEFVDWAKVEKAADVSRLQTKS